MKKKKEQEIVEEGEVVPQKEPKQQKTTKDKRQAFSVESMEAKNSVDVCYPTWNPQLELDGAVVPGALPSGRREATPLTWSMLWSVPSCCLRTWTL